MITSAYTSQSGMVASQALLDVTSNNIANSNTTAFKASQINFQDLLYFTLSGQGSAVAQGQFSPQSVQIGQGTTVSSISGNFAQGTIQNTGQPLDVAINGNGFFRVTTAGGQTAYTRDGVFSLDANGRLVTQNGDILTPPITIPLNAQTITIASDGTVTVTAGTPPTTQQVGQITLARFANNSGLLRLGNSLFAETPASGPPLVSAPGTNGAGTLQQGALENSNVNVTTELINLILAQSTFSFNAQAFQVSNQLLQTTLQQL
jgi:flagellar basal-body rod protein FlgG